MKKRMLALILVMCMLVLNLAACTQPDDLVPTTAAQGETSGKTESTKADEEPTTEEGPKLWNEPGVYPIVNEPYTLKIAVVNNNPGVAGEWVDSEFIKYVQEKSGITIEFIEYETGEQQSLMWAAQEYADIIMGLGTDRQVADAAAAGDLVALDDYWEEYAPNWYNFLTANPTYLAQITRDDGHIYQFPAIYEEEARELRDVWVIRKDWLEQVGKEVPTTVEEFYDVLCAFRDNKGVGVIPANAIPYNTAQWGAYNNGVACFVNSFGTLLSFDNYFNCTIDENGKVEFNWTNEAIKEPFKWLHKFVEEDLIPEDCLVKSIDTAIQENKSKDGIVGVYQQNQNVSGNKGTELYPLETGSGKTGYFRPQVNQLMRNAFIITKECEHPEIAMLFVNMLGEHDMALQAQKGMMDGTFLEVAEKTPEGTFIVKDYTNGEQRKSSAVPGNNAQWPFLITSEAIAKCTYEAPTKKMLSVAKYQDAGVIISRDRMWPQLDVSEENLDRLSELKNDIVGHINSTIADWGLNGGIDEGWDAYIDQLYALGLEEYLELLQEEYDAFMEKTK